MKRQETRSRAWLWMTVAYLAGAAAGLAAGAAASRWFGLVHPL